MTFHSLEEMYEAKRGALDRIERLVQDLTDAQVRFRPAGEGWSIAGILEHLVIVERQLLQLIPTLLAKAEKTSPSARGRRPFELYCVRSVILKETGANTMKEQDEKEKGRGNRRAGINMGMGMAIGIAVGVALGTAMDNLAAGIAIGVALGAGLGSAFSGRKKQGKP